MACVGNIEGRFNGVVDGMDICDCAGMGMGGKLSKSKINQKLKKKMYVGVPGVLTSTCYTLLHHLAPFPA
jgi:hypothetical protein